MTQQTKPSAGALRAAIAIEGHLWADIPNAMTKGKFKRGNCAEIIDRETGVAELLEAAGQAIKTGEQVSVLLYELNVGGLVFREHEAALSRLQAIAKCEGR
ncbi:hypothetical protein LCGC14_1312410 [marine sediment metagenome]|uniref:Uncharacterized protein n=1 Tax=marine sediment metagenome TaxID=412755 RepID=A0A0F9KME4_9ZZZZ